MWCSPFTPRMIPSIGPAEAQSTVENNAPWVYNQRRSPVLASIGGAAVKQHAGVLVLLFASMAIATALVDAHGPSAREPLWAYGFLTPPTVPWLTGHVRRQ